MNGVEARGGEGGVRVANGSQCSAKKVHCDRECDGTPIWNVSLSLDRKNEERTLACT